MSRRIHVTHREWAIALSQRPPEYRAQIAQAIAATTETGMWLDAEHPAYRQAKALYSRHPRPAPTPRIHDPILPWPLMGRALWQEIHQRPWTLAIVDSAVEANYLRLLPRRFPSGCGCKRDWLAYLSTSPPDCRDAQSYFAWTVAAHNHVNQRLGRPTLSLDEALSLWKPEAPTIPRSAPAGIFDEVWYINLDRREDRRADFEARIAELSAAGQWPMDKPQRFAAIDGRANGRDGVWGCLQSHRTLLAQAIARGARNLCVFEDDAIFADRFGSRLLSFLSNVPADWDALWLGHQEASWLPDGRGRSTLILPPSADNGGVGVRRSRWPHRLHGYVLRSRAMRAVLDTWLVTDGHADHAIGQLLGTGGFSVYIPTPLLVGQAAGRSDLTCGQNCEHWWQPPAAGATAMHLPRSQQHSPVTETTAISTRRTPSISSSDSGKLPWIGDRLVLLECDRATREALRALGLHGGYDIAMDGGDRYLNKLFYRQRDLASRVKQIVDWLPVIQNEAAMAAKTPALWLSNWGQAEAAALRQATKQAVCATGKPCIEITCDSADDAIGQLTPYAIKRPKETRAFAIMSLRNGSVDLLPHWLEYYQMLGVDRMLIGIYSDVMGRAEEVAALTSGYNVGLTTYSMGEWTDELQNEHHRTMLRVAGAQASDWVLWTDLDEFLEFPAPLRQIMQACDEQGIDGFKGYFVDRVSADGILRAVTPAPSIFEQYPVGCQITKNLMGGWTQKVMLARYRVRTSTGHHTANTRLRRVPIGNGSDYKVHHFKWRDGLIERLDWALAHASDHIWNWANEARKFKRWYTEAGNKIDLNDKRIY